MYGDFWRMGICFACFWLFGRQVAGVVQRKFEPSSQIDITGDAPMFYENESGHWTADTQAARCKWPRQRFSFCSRAHASHEPLGRDAAQHVAVEHDGQAAEHGLDDGWLVNDPAHPLGQ